MRKALANVFLMLLGWRVVGELPTSKKYIMIMAPHTSNWDFIIGKIFGYKFNIETKFLAKSQLFRFPLGWFFKWMGGISVNREKKNNLVANVVNLFNNSENLILGIAPEGTRSRVSKWKLGFYHISVAANIPIIVAFLDYKKKEVGIGMTLYTSGDLEADLLKIQTFYQGITAKYPEKYNPQIF